MATNIDKALYSDTQGAGPDMTDEPIEIEIVDPEAVNIHADGLDIEIGKAHEEDFYRNLAEDINPNELSKMASDLAGDIENDKGSRKEWEKAYVMGLKLLGLQYEERTEPWNGASGVFHPMITEAVVRFQSETITEMFPAQGPVRTKILGKETPQKKQAAIRVEDDMNYELTEVMVEFRPEHERMLWSLPATGSAFKKVYDDITLGRQTSMFVPAEDIILPYGTTDMDTCYRMTHVMRKTKNEILKLQKAGFYLDFELPDSTQLQDDIQKAKDQETGFNDLNDDRYVIYEVHVDLDLKGFEDQDENGNETGIALPYVVTLIKGSNDVLSIRRNWKEDDENRLKRQHFVHYQYIPGFGAYGFGLFHLIGGFAKSATSIMRQLVDAGTLSNLPGGLKSRGLRIKGDDTPIAPGEFRDVDIASGPLRDNILPLPYKEPSAVLAGLLEKIVEEGRRFAATADMQISDMSSQAPVGTTLALLERQLKVMTAVQARMHYAFKQELKLLAALIKEDTPVDYDYEPEYGSKSAKQSDYDQVDIIPVSDPNAATMSQRVVQYQSVIQMAQMAPDIYDLPELHRRMLEVMGVKGADKLVPLPDDIKPSDPVSENMAILKMEPVKAFEYQDHQAHISVHMAAMQDPMIMQLIGQNPNAPKIQGAMTAHIAEHVGLEYKKQIEAQLGMAIPKPDEEQPIPPQIEFQMSQRMAQAAQAVLQQHKQQMAQQQAQQQAQDPMMQLQQQELQLRGRELDIRQQEAQAKAAQAQATLQLKAEEFQARQDMEGRKLNVNAIEKAGRLNMDKERIQADHSRIRIDAANKQAQLEEGRKDREVDLYKHATDRKHESRQAQDQRAHEQEMQANAPAPQPKEKPTK
jgi:hypothetical protein